MSKAFNWIVALASRIPGKMGGLANKAFGNLSYDQEMSKCDFEYQKVSMEELIKRIEGLQIGEKGEL